MLVQREIDWRDGKRLTRLLKAARLKVSSAQCCEAAPSGQAPKRIHAAEPTGSER